MSNSLLWFTGVIGYVIQTKCISTIQSRQVVATSASEQDAAGVDTGNTSSGTYILTLYLTFIYFASWTFLMPIAKMWKEFKQSTEPDQADLVPIVEGDEDPEHRNTNRMLLQYYQRQANKNNQIVSWRNFTYFLKLMVLTALLIIALVTYNLALSMSPAFDVALIQNTSIFEIVTLLYGVCGLARRQNVFRNFIIMLTALIGILIISYTKATCDMLSGKLSINKDTGELSDPFLFDRLKSSLLCGLGALTIDPFAVLWNRWFGGRSRSSSVLTKTLPQSSVSHSLLEHIKARNAVNSFVKQCTHLSFIGLVGMIVLFPFLPAIPTSSETVSFLYSDRTFWLSAMVGIVFGVIPCLLSLLLLNRNASPEYLTTCNLGAIIFMGISDWISEPTQTTIIRWEVIGYIILTICCLILSFTFNEKKMQH